MDLGGEAAAGAAKRLEVNPPFSPAAQRCARIVVLSSICKAPNSSPPSANPCNMTSHTPDWHQRRNCRQTEFQLPNASGRSRHGAHVRQIHSIASTARRRLAAGRPPRGEEFVRKDATIAHSSSVIKRRVTTNFHGEMVGLESYSPRSKESLTAKKILRDRDRPVPIFFAEFRRTV